MGIHLKENRYLVREKIAKGGMGEIFSAYDTTLQRNVAIKKVLNSSEKSGYLKFGEAQLLASLNHSNILQVYDTFDIQNEHYIVTELIEGESLDSFLSNHQSSLSERLIWLRDITSAILYSHENNVVHGDIKLENVMISLDGKIKLTDFGLGRYNNQSHINLNVGGSLEYMAPETILDKQINKKTDLFSLGVLAYKLVCNTSPFGSNQSVQAHQHGRVAGNLIPIKLFNNHVSKQLALIIEKLLEINSDKRNVQLQELINEIERCLKSKIDFSFSQSQHIDSETNVTRKFSNKLSGKKSFRFALLAIAAASALLTIFNYHFLNKDEPVSKKALVLILEPSIEEESNLSKELADQVKLTLLDSLQRSVESTHELSNAYYPSKISPSELSNQLAFYGADEALLSKINCQKRICKFTIYRVNKDGKAVIRERKWAGLVDSLTALSTMTMQMHASLYDKLNFKNSVSTITEENYKRYLELYQRLRLEKIELKASMSELEDLIIKSPKFLPLYHLYRETSLNLYHHSKNKAYLANLRKHLELAQVYFPHSPEIVAHYFWLAVSQHDFDEAENYLSKIRDLKTEYFLALELSAYFYLEKGDYLKAVQAYEQLTDSQPSRKNFYNYALSTWYLGDYTLALEILTKLLKIFPEDYSAQKLSATCHLTLGNIKSAIRLYEKTASRKPSASNFSNLGLSYFINQDYKKALESFLSALEYNSNNVEALINIADAYKATGDISKSTESYSKALQILQNREDWRSKILKSQIYAQLGKFKDAVKHLQSLQLNRSPNAEIYYTAALVYTLAGDKTSAIVNIEKAIQKNFGKIWFHLPWFKALCERRDFASLVNLENRQKFCKLP